MMSSQKNVVQPPSLRKAAPQLKQGGMEAWRQPGPGRRKRLERSWEKPADLPTSPPRVGSPEEQEEDPRRRDLQRPGEESARDSPAAAGAGRSQPGHLPVPRKAKTWAKLQGLEDEKVAGVHWGYEETKILGEDSR
ncbi:chondroitin sulfate synthase 3-like [Suricata suricatta]|uniref:chondroitin sulfate synthase 3-like n=1 Tax=Suricata suricatta TaxID=37032 RepID=UPI001155F119|nr:chondroitin sulfate synthase 3-like [Suricata suricatta]